MDGPGGQKVLSLFYIKLLRLTLLPVGGWPNLKQNMKKSQLNARIIFLIIQIFILIGELIYLSDIIGVVEVLLAGDAYITTFMTILSMVRLCMCHFNTYNDIFRRFVEEFHLIHYKHKGGSFVKVFSTVEKISHHYALFLVGAGVSGLFLFNLSPLYVNIKNGAFTTNKHNLSNVTLAFTVNYKYPGYIQEERFIVTSVINIYLSFLCSTSIVSTDLLMILIIFHIIGHLEILAMNMRSMQKPSEKHLVKDISNKSVNKYTIEIFNEQENLEIKQVLREMIEHHKLIISFTDKLTNFFGPLLAFNYLFHLVGCCLLLLECTDGDPDVIIRYVPLTAMIFMQLIQTSVIFETVTHKSNNLINCVYDLPWECMDVGSQRIVYIMLLRVQTPIRITALGMADVGVKTMANFRLLHCSMMAYIVQLHHARPTVILKTIFSYYTFLQSL